MESLCSMIYYSTALPQREWAIELLQLCVQQMDDTQPYDAESREWQWKVCAQ